MPGNAEKATRHNEGSILLTRHGVFSPQRAARDPLDPPDQLSHAGPLWGEIALGAKVIRRGASHGYGPPRNYTPKDHRTKASQIAGNRVIELCEIEGAKVLSLGGGPFRIHPKIITLNIEAFEGVDLVGDAHRLPLVSASIDAVHCEAVFEHLRDPDTAAQEMLRVMKPGALAFICTPFMQPFHGYPSHFQNYTVFGHRRLFERAGFDVLESGSCVGPSWAVAHIVTFYIAQYAPRWVRWFARPAWSVLGRLFLRPLDHWLSERDDAYVLASTTYVLVSKPRL